jgi:multidrug transporter EmrE-like cation transporter
MGMFIISNLLGSTIQITTLPLPVLSTLQASGLVFNSICATLILGEPFTRWSLGGTLLVCAGAVLIAIFGAIPEPAHNLDQLLVLLRRGPFILWMLGQAALVVLITATATSLARYSSSPRVRLLRGLAFGCISGILSAHSLLFAKISVELLVRTIIDHKNQFDRYQSSLILATLITLALVQLYYLHHGLKLVSTSVLYPLVFCIYNIIAILDGLIYFHQTSLLTPLAAWLIALGTLILLSGVLALSWRLSDEQSPPPPPSALTPGLGLIDDEDTDSPLPTPGTPDEETALLPNHNHTHTPYTPFSPLSPHSPGATAKLDSVLSQTRTARTAETEAIWEELQDRDGAQRHSHDYGTVEREGDETAARQRRRRRSTGFRGFIPRDAPRTSSNRGVMGRLFGRWGQRRRSGAVVQEEEESGTW